MTGFDGDRIALVVAQAVEGGPAQEAVATGYFLTGDLVLTARHAAENLPGPISVRAEVGGTEEDHWSEATVVWIGSGDIDAIVVRTARSFGDWSPPSFVADFDSGSWRSSGFARAAADETGTRKTLPLTGSASLSRGQGPPELALQADQTIASDWESHWKGISGAPVFSVGPGEDGLIGIVTDANRALSNGLVGLPAARLRDDIRLLSILSPSFLSGLPERPWCMVLTAEEPSSDLVGQVADVLASDRNGPQLLRELLGEELHPDPLEVRVLDALSSVENWAVAVDALARADFLVVDVTSFEPGVMLLLGVRSVLRRGVTISVAGPDLAASALTLPFNVQETRVLSYDDEGFHDDLLRTMAEGATCWAQDPTYLDLPAYHGVRAPRPPRWAEDDPETVLVLCPFGGGYATVYKKLRTLIRSHTQHNMNPVRMLDLRSPRLVGQALYEQIRWATSCLVDWTGWRANVFFELGVRLACSEHDPLSIIDGSDLEGCAGEGAPAVEHRKQCALLRNLLNPIVYERADPRKALKTAIEVRMTRRSDRLDARPDGALPPSSTFAVAQSSFLWRRDPLLTRPDRELREGALRIFGRDQEKRPERLILFAANERFEAELVAAVREKWIAAWLYLRHVTSAEGGVVDDEVQAEFARVSQFVEQVLASSGDARHKALRKEVRELRRAQRAQRAQTRGEADR